MTSILAVITKCHKLGGLWTTGSCSSQFWSWEVWDQGARRFGVWWGLALFLFTGVPSHCVLTATYTFCEETNFPTRAPHILIIPYPPCPLSVYSSSRLLLLESKAGLTFTIRIAWARQADLASSLFMTNKACGSVPDKRRLKRRSHCSQALGLEHTVQLFWSSVFFGCKIFS